jgi:hypothetical protein
MEYKGWKIPNKLYIYAKKNNGRYEFPQAMIASSNSSKAIDTAKRWASGKYTNYNLNDYTEYILDNNDLTLEILDSADSSSQGGKLSFWNCIISKDNMNVVVGIGSDLLLDLIRNSDFEKGKCKQKVTMARIGQHWGALHKNMSQYNEAIEDIKLSKTIDKSKKTSSWEKGYEYYTKTKNKIYLYDLYVWRSSVNTGVPFWYSKPRYDIIEYSKPKKIKVTEWCSFLKNRNITKLSEVLDCGLGVWNSSYYSSYLKLPPMIKGDKMIDIDLTNEQIEEKLKENRDKILKEYLEKECYGLGYVLDTFGVNTSPEKPPEIPKELLDKMEKEGVQIINE